MRAIECFAGLMAVGLLTLLLCVGGLPRVRPPADSGRLLLSLRPSDRRRRTAVAIALSGLGGATLCTLLQVFAPQQSAGRVPFDFQATLGIFAGSCLFAFFLGVASHSVEIRENGVVGGNGRWFAPWRSVGYCEWQRRAGTLLTLRIRPRGDIILGNLATGLGVRPDQIADVTRILACRVEVRDEDGRTVTPPSEPGQERAPLEELPARRGRLQFDLKTGLLLFLLVASAAGWYSIRRQRPQQREWRVIASLETAFPGLIGSPQGVRFNAGPRMPKDEDLAALTKLRSLASLELYGAPITDRGMRVLGNLTGLRFLDICGTKVTDAGLKELSGLSSVKCLRLANTAVSDAGMATLASFRGLTSLTLSGTKVTDAGIANLAGLELIGYLDLAGTRVTDAGMVSLARLQSLSTLDLSGTRVTDAAVEHLAKLRHLRDVFLCDTKITVEGRMRLSAALPKLMVDGRRWKTRPTEFD
jgi:hypothetical protein